MLIFLVVIVHGVVGKMVWEMRLGNFGVGNMNEDTGEIDLLWEPLAVKMRGGEGGTGVRWNAIVGEGADGSGKEAEKLVEPFKLERFLVGGMGESDSEGECAGTRGGEDVIEPQLLSNGSSEVDNKVTASEPRGDSFRSKGRLALLVIG